VISKGAYIYFAINRRLCCEVGVFVIVCTCVSYITVLYLVRHVLAVLLHDLRPVLHAQAKKKKKEEAANAKLLEAEKRTKVSVAENQEFLFLEIKTSFA
jgi:hypothetical protein